MTSSQLQDGPRIGIVVIGRNEGERLVRSLRSLDVGTHRVVYVDSGSTDGSLQIAEQLGAEVVTLDMSKPFTAARARNYGFATLMQHHQDLRFVQFIDGDCELDARWIETAARFLATRSDVALVCGRRREKFPERSIYNKLCDMEWDTPIGETRASGGDFLVRVSAFQQVDGFTDHFIAGEEPELCARLREAGWKIWRLDAEMTRHDADILHVSQWWRRCMRSGYAFASNAHAHGNGPDQLGKRATISIIVWGGVLPMVFILGALLHPAALLGFLLYPVQIARIAVRRAHQGKDGLLYAASVVIGKFAEVIGVAKFTLARLSGRHSPLIEYK